MEDWSQNLWEIYGFKGNPFNTSPLSINPENPLSIKNAYVNRVASPQAKRFENFFRDPDGGRIIIEGEPGVGKTTFVNYYRYKWSYEAGQKLFTHFREIQIESDFSAKDFLMACIYHLLQQLRLEIGEDEFHKNNFLKEALNIVSVDLRTNRNTGAGLSVAGIGGVQLSASKASQVQVGELSAPMLFAYFRKVCTLILEKNYAGIILHFDNLEIIGRRHPESLESLFEDIRDYLQLDKVYFIFVGQNGLFRSVVFKLERVRSIFSSEPVVIEAMDANDIHHIIKKRYQTMSSHDNWHSPVGVDLIDKLNSIFKGKIRYIMNEISSLIKDMEQTGATLEPGEAIKRLKAIKKAEAHSGLTEKAYEIFIIAASYGTFTPSMIIESSGDSRQFINKVLAQTLVPKGFVYKGEKRGRAQFYNVAPDFLMLQQ